MLSNGLKRSYFRSPVDWTWRKQFTPAQLLDRRGAENPDKEAIVVLADGSRTAITFGQLKDRSEQLAAGMIRAGLEIGERVGLLLPTSIEYAVCEYAIMRTGAIVVHFPATTINTIGALEAILKKTRCRWLFAYRGAGDYDCTKILHELIPGLSTHNPSNNINIGSLPNLETIFIIPPEPYPGTFSWSALFDNISKIDKEKMHTRQSKIQLAMVHSCYCSSGSTGTPKCIAVPGSWLLVEVSNLYKHAGLDETDRTLCHHPMSYGGGGTLSILAIGCTHYVVIAATSGPDADKGLDLYFKTISNEQITGLYMFPFMLGEFLQHIRKGLDVSKIKCCQTGGEFVHTAYLRELYQRGVPISNGYGLIETSDFCWTVHTDPIEVKVQKTGRCHEGEVKIVDEVDVVVPFGEPGEICMRCDHMFVEYLGDEAKTKQLMDSKGWFHTGDIGILDEEGYLINQGRKVDVFTKEGQRVYPQLIEAIFSLHPKVNEVVACGIPHPTMNQEICVCIVPKNGAGLTSEEMHLFCKEQLVSKSGGSKATPDYLLMFDKFPHGITHKIDRRKVRKEAVCRVEKGWECFRLLEKNA